MVKFVQFHNCSVCSEMLFGRYFRISLNTVESHSNQDTTSIKNCPLFLWFIDWYVSVNYRVSMNGTACFCITLVLTLRSNLFLVRTFYALLLSTQIPLSAAFPKLVKNLSEDDYFLAINSNRVTKQKPVAYQQLL